MSLETLLNGVKTLAVVCNQWGDTGKGKFVDYFAEWADIIARGTGGANAGHTIFVNGKEMIFHLLPCGIVYDDQGKISVLGNGMVIDPSALCAELEMLEAEGKTYNNLRVSKYAHVVLPYHIAEDRLKNASQIAGGIGTTGRGIGPCYADKIARRGVMITDLVDQDVLVNKIRKLAPMYSLYGGTEDEVIHKLQTAAEKIKPFVCDTGKEIHHLRKQGKRILLEGAQGLLLSIEHGIYPYVTSSDCSLNGTASGVGLAAKDIHLSLGLIKFPYMTRVGAGAFPTELGGAKAEAYCREEILTREVELQRQHIPFVRENNRIRYDRHHQHIIELMNHPDPLMQNRGMRLAGGEYGATTGRPRRIGWTDGFSGRYAANINRSVLVLTKPDALAGMKQFRLCFGYDKGGQVTTDFDRDDAALRQVTPFYQTYEGYGDIRDVRTYEALPKSLTLAIEDFERFTDARVGLVSVGPEREHTIVK